MLQPDGSYLLNSQAITEYFAQRMKKDPRFKDTKSDKYKQGILDEIARIKSVWNNAVMLEDCLSYHPEIRYNYARYTQLVKSDPENYTEDAYHNTKELTYGINLGALTGGAVDVNSEYSKVVLDENGEIASTSANNVIICVFNYSKQQPDLQFETLGFVNFMIARYSNFLNVNAPLVIA